MKSGHDSAPNEPGKFKSKQNEACGSVNEIEKIDATVIILAKNEELHIARAVKSADKFRQVLVVDSSSTDNTVTLAEGAGAEVIQFIWDGAYPKKKEWALEYAECDWVLYLDADEFFEPALVQEIADAISRPDLSAIEVPLKYYWMGQELTHGHKVMKRIGMRRSLCYWPRPDDLDVQNMWEVEGHYQPQNRSGAIFNAQAALGHQDEDGLYDYFARHNRYSDWEARMLYRREPISRESRSKLGRLAVKMPAKPILFFIYSYILKMGFLDGRPGLHYAIALSFYYWQIDLKLHELKNDI